MAAPQAAIDPTIQRDQYNNNTDLEGVPNQQPIAPTSYPFQEERDVTIVDPESEAQEAILKEESDRDKQINFNRGGPIGFNRNPDFYWDQGLIPPRLAFYQIPYEKRHLFGPLGMVNNGPLSRTDNIYDYGAGHPGYYLQNYRRIRGYGVAYAPEI